MSVYAHAMAPHHRTVLFQGPADVYESGLASDGKPVDWHSPTGKKLARLMIPTAQMINFRIAHEVGHLKKFDFLPTILLPPCVLVFGYHFSALLPKCNEHTIMTIMYSLLVHILILFLPDMFPRRYAKASFPLLFAITLLFYLHLSTYISEFSCPLWVIPQAVVLSISPMYSV